MGDQSIMAVGERGLSVEPSSSALLFIMYLGLGESVGYVSLHQLFYKSLKCTVKSKCPEHF